MILSLLSTNRYTDRTPLDKIPSRQTPLQILIETISPRTKSPRAKSPRDKILTRQNPHETKSPRDKIPSRQTPLQILKIIKQKFLVLITERMHVCTRYVLGIYSCHLFYLVSANVIVHNIVSLSC